MIELKTESEIEIMKQSGAILRKSVDELMPQVKEGMTTLELDTLAEELIRKNGGESSFKKVEGYRWTTCVPVNEQIVHTPPSNRKLKKGDVLTVDIGAYFKGFHSDYATTVVIGGSEDPKITKFLKTGQTTLDKAIAVAKAGAYIGEISAVIQKEIQGAGYFILKQLTGHGIGRELHEDPFVPGILDRPIEKTYKIQPGLVIAVEIIYSMGSEKMKYEGDDHWSIITADRSIAACFEKTIAITDKNTFILT